MIYVIYLLDSASTLLNTSQLAQPYTTAMTCSVASTNSTGNPQTLLAAHPNAHNSITMSNLSTAHHHHHHHHQHHSSNHSATATATSPYIFLSAAPGNGTTDEVCAHGTGGTASVITGKTATLSQPSTLYFYNNSNHHHHHTTPAMCAPLTFYTCDRQI